MGIPFTDLARLGLTFGSNDGAIWGGADSHNPLREPVDEQSSCLGMPAIEPEGELIKVIVEVPMLNTAQVSAVQPSLEKRSPSTNRMARTFHPSTLQAPARSVNGIPIC